MALPEPNHYWPFFEGSGTQATDVLWGVRMTMSRESWGVGRWSRALRLHPADGPLLVTTACADREPPWTAAMWLRREEDTGAASLFSSRQFALKLEQYDGQHAIGITRFGHYDRSFTCGTPLGEWVHLAFVGTERDVAIFINGEPQDKLAVPLVSLPLSWVGSTEGYTDFGAFSLAELKVFHQALTTEQIVEVYGQPQRPATLLEGVVNQYAAVTQIRGKTVTLGGTSDSWSLRPSDQVLLIQMTGAAIDRSSSVPGEYGRITDLGRAGCCELHVVSAVDAATVTLAQPIADERLDPRRGKVQLVRAFCGAEDVHVKQKVKALPWNGEIGGVIAIFTEGTLSLGDHVDASGQGFPGGLASGSGPARNAKSDPRLEYGQQDRAAGWKGAGLVAIDREWGAGRGAMANGGGGGNPFVGGGGGGGHAGPGGMGTSYVNERETGGLGGHALRVADADADRIFMGGGGGGGALSAQPQPEASGRGGDGGGIVIVRARCIVGSSESGIRANGRNAEAAYDGAGGGGAGGTIVLVAQERRGAFAMEARGGSGASNHSYASGDGAGGGGGGGMIRATAPLPFPDSWSTSGGKGGRNADEALAGGAGIMVMLEDAPLSLSPVDLAGVDLAVGPGKRRESEKSNGTLDETPSTTVGRPGQGSTGRMGEPVQV